MRITVTRRTLARSKTAPLKRMQPKPKSPATLKMPKKMKVTAPSKTQPVKPKKMKVTIKKRPDKAKKTQTTIETTKKRQAAVPAIADRKTTIRIRVSPPCPAALK